METNGVSDRFRLRHLSNVLLMALEFSFGYCLSLTVGDIPVFVGGFWLVTRRTKRAAPDLKNLLLPSLWI